MSVLSEVKKALDIQEPPSAVVRVGLLYYKLEGGTLYYTVPYEAHVKWVPSSYTPEWVTQYAKTGNLYKKGKAAGWW